MSDNTRENEFEGDINDASTQAGAARVARKMLENNPKIDAWIVYNSFVEKMRSGWWEVQSLPRGTKRPTFKGQAIQIHRCSKK